METEAALATNKISQNSRAWISLVILCLVNANLKTNLVKSTQNLELYDVDGTIFLLYLALYPFAALATFFAQRRFGKQIVLSFMIIISSVTFEINTYINWEHQLSQNNNFDIFSVLIFLSNLSTYSSEFISICLIFSLFTSKNQFIALAFYLSSQCAINHSLFYISQFSGILGGNQIKDVFISLGLLFASLVATHFVSMKRIIISKRSTPTHLKRTGGLIAGLILLAPGVFINQLVICSEYSKNLYPSLYGRTYVNFDEE